MIIGAITAIKMGIVVESASDICGPTKYPNPHFQKCLLTNIVFPLQLYYSSHCPWSALCKFPPLPI